MDPVSNMLIGIKNANRALRDTVVFPQAKFTFAIAQKLSKEGFVGAITTKTRKGRPVFEVELLSTDRMPKVTEINRVSKSSRRMYTGVADVKAVQNGRGVLFISTPKGILTDKEARKEHVGGEVLFSIW